MKNYLSLFDEQTWDDEIKSRFTDRGIDVKEYPDHEMVLLNYNQINCKKDDPIAVECRGLLVSYDGTCVRKGFHRFFNLGECDVDDFNFKRSIIKEKMDGSLVLVYWCPSTKKWEIGTRGNAFAEGNNDAFGTFRLAILNGMGRTEDQFQVDCETYFHTKETRIYEYCGPANRIVTKYESAFLAPLATFNNDTWEEIVGTGWLETSYCDWNIKVPRVYKFDTKDACLDTLSSLPGLGEGYVCTETDTGLRVKIKSPAYVAAHHLRGNGLNLKSISSLIILNEVDEYLTSFPEDKERFEIPNETFKHIMVDITSEHEKYNHIEDQKEFALAIKDYHRKGILFTARKLNCSAIEAFEMLPLNKKVDIAVEATRGFELSLEEYDEEIVSDFSHK